MPCYYELLINANTTHMTCKSSTDVQQSIKVIFFSYACH